MLRSSLFQLGEEMLLGSSSWVKGNTAAYGDTNGPALFITEAAATSRPGVVTTAFSDAYLHKHEDITQCHTYRTKQSYNLERVRTIL